MSVSHFNVSCQSQRGQGNLFHFLEGFFCFFTPMPVVHNVSMHECMHEWFVSEHLAQHLPSLYKKVLYQKNLLVNVLDNQSTEKQLNNRKHLNNSTRSQFSSCHKTKLMRQDCCNIKGQLANRLRSKNLHLQRKLLFKMQFTFNAAYSLTCVG